MATSRKTAAAKRTAAEQTKAPAAARATIGADAFPPRGPGEETPDGNAVTIEQEMIARGQGTVPLPATPQQPVIAATNLFVRLPNGALVQYRAGDRLDPAHRGLPTVPGVIGPDGVMQPS